jgi:hypothetical protein
MLLEKITPYLAAHFSNSEKEIEKLVSFLNLSSVKIEGRRTDRIGTVHFLAFRPP